MRRTTRIGNRFRREPRRSSRRTEGQFRTLLAFAVLVAPFAARSAHGRPAATARLVYTRGLGAEQCPDEGAVRDGIAERLGYEPFAADAPMTVSATLARTPGGLRAQVDIRDASGHLTRSRQLTSAANDCAELAEAKTLAISLAIDPLNVARPPAAPPSIVVSSSPQAVTPSPPPVSAPIARIEPRDAPPPRPSAERDPWIPRASLGALLALGSAPAPALGVAGAFGVRWRAVSINAEGRVDLPSSATFDGSARARTWLLLASFVPCVHQDMPRRGSWMLCGIGSVGSIQGSGAGVDVPLQDSSLYGAAGARIGYEAPATWVVAPRIYGDLLATLTSTTVHLDGKSIWTTPTVSGVFGAGAVIRFP